MTKDLEQEEVYKYLGFGVSNGVQHAAVKKKKKENSVTGEYEQSERQNSPLQIA